VTSRWFGNLCTMMNLPHPVGAQPSGRVPPSHFFQIQYFQQLKQACGDCQVLENTWEPKTLAGAAKKGAVAR
jgi:hypothetical protein